MRQNCILPVVLLVNSWRRDDRKEEREECETIRRPHAAASVSKEQEKEDEKEKGAWRTEKDREALRRTRNETDEDGWTTVRR